MDDEFKLCWKNFQDNIASGFQNLYDRGDLVDVTLACDGKLLHAHKIVLAICSPYFQEIFITNPCKHPIIILKDVTFNIMCELLEFMYQGVVNVKHTELQSFMKIGQLLQIKGLATNASSTAGTTSTDKSTSQTHNADEASSACADAENNSSATPAKTGTNRAASASDDVNTSDGLSSVKLSNPISVKSHSPASSPSPMSFAESTTNANQPNFKSSPVNNLPFNPNYPPGANLKRHVDLNNDALSIYSRKQFRRSIASADHNTDHSDSADADAESDYFLPSIPHLASNSSAAAAAAAFRGTFNPAAFGFDYNLYKNSSAAGASSIGGACGGNASGVGGAEYPNDLHLPSDYSKNFANHVDIPPNSSNVVMLSSTSLLHGSCVFNRNNTVATQQGMKTYWLCKSYRISMCRARCITHQGRVISATGVHNHPPHMRGSGPGGGGMGNSSAGSNSNAGSGGNGSGFPIDVNAQQPSAVAATSNSSTINLNSINMPGVLLPGATNSAANVSSASGARLHHTTASGAIGTPMYQQHNTMHNSPGQQLQLHQQQQQQQQLQHQQHQLHTVSGCTTPPPMSAGLMGNSHLHAHTTQAATSLLMSHHSAPDNGSMAGNVHHHHHPHQHHTIGGSGNGAMGGAGSGTQNLHSNSVIQNILHSANASNAMHHHHHPQLPHMSHLSQHQHHHQQHEAHLEITPLMQSPPLPPPPPLHLQSPSNQSNQSQHGSGGANSLSSPITTTPASAASGSALKSPSQTNLSDEAIRVSEAQSHAAHAAHLSEQHQHLLSHGTTLSPSEINSNTAVSSHSTDGANEAQHQAHVIDSITISPGEGHSFKMEDM
ncbi:broad-complex core protein isoforms 1/2/3/4/5 [Zeugodacus cucurbitae]|nr:broad-complex core protein isoforms 1/2/3/4/5 [Zeugodacus cucurbitae]